MKQAHFLYSSFFELENTFWLAISISFISPQFSHPQNRYPLLLSVKIPNLAHRCAVGDLCLYWHILCIMFEQSCICITALKCSSSANTELKELSTLHTLHGPSSKPGVVCSSLVSRLSNLLSTDSFSPPDSQSFKSHINQLSKKQ